MKIKPSSSTPGSPVNSFRQWDFLQVYSSLSLPQSSPSQGYFSLYSTKLNMPRHKETFLPGHRTTVGIEQTRKIYFLYMRSGKGLGEVIPMRKGIQVKQKKWIYQTTDYNKQDLNSLKNNLLCQRIIKEDAPHVRDVGLCPLAVYNTATLVAIITMLLF